MTTFKSTISISGNTFEGSGSTRIASATDAFRAMLTACELNSDPLPMTFELGTLTIDREPTEREKKIMEETMRRMGKDAPLVTPRFVITASGDAKLDESKGEDASAIAAQANIVPPEALNPNPNEIERQMLAKKVRK